MAGNSLFGYNNYALTGTLAANSAETGLGPTNLASHRCTPATGWQTTSGVVAYSSGGAALLNCTNPIPGTICRVTGLFRTNLTPSAQVTFQYWRDFGAGPVLQDQVTVGGPQPGFGQVIVVLDEDVTCDFTQILFEDPTNPDGHINVGGFFTGPAWLPRTGWTWATADDEETIVSTTMTRGGQEYSTMLNTRRVLIPTLDFITPGEVWDNLGELRRVSRQRANILAIPSIADVDMNRTAVFGTVDQPAPVTYPNPGLNLRGWSCRITERL